MDHVGDHTCELYPIAIFEPPVVIFDPANTPSPVLLLTLVTAQVFASSGRTNSQGCHNSQTEGYHCH